MKEFIKNRIVISFSIIASQQIRKSYKDLPVVFVTIRRIDPAGVEGRAALRHVSIAQIRKGSAADAHAASAQHLAVAQVTGSDVYVGVVVMTTDMMMRR